LNLSRLKDMHLFVLSTHCQSRAHCKVCRNFDGGRKWRESLSKAYQLPNNDVDFECPYGMQWSAGSTSSSTPQDGQPQPTPPPRRPHLRADGSPVQKRPGGCGCSRS
jgi:hypothetical protein